jgi:hypothetical protein
VQRSKERVGHGGFSSCRCRKPLISQFRFKVRVPSMPSIEMVAVVAVISRH